VATSATSDSPQRCDAPIAREAFPAAAASAAAAGNDTAAAAAAASAAAAGNDTAAAAAAAAVEVLHEGDAWAVFTDMFEGLLDLEALADLFQGA
jgi:hypothetical protein